MKHLKYLTERNSRLRDIEYEHDQEVLRQVTIKNRNVEATEYIEDVFLPLTDLGLKLQIGSNNINTLSLNGNIIYDVYISKGYSVSRLSLSEISNFDEHKHKMIDFIETIKNKSDVVYKEIPSIINRLNNFGRVISICEESLMGSEACVLLKFIVKIQ